MYKRAFAVLVGTAALQLAVAPAGAQSSTPSSPSAAPGVLPTVPVEPPAVPAARPVQKAPPKPAQRPVAQKQSPPPQPAVTPPPAGGAPAAAPAGIATQLNINPGTPSFGAKPVFGLAGQPGGQTVTAIDTKRLESDPVFSAGDVLKESPGVSIKQGNGPRDMGVSIRGSNARNGFGVRNIVVYEDGFPVTQPDGLSRTDLTDPHAYGGVDVWRGPSSAMFGNYATGGAINFRVRPGGEINGVETGVDVGSFGYVNTYTAIGTKIANAEVSLFASDVRGNGNFEYSAFNTQTLNFLMTLQITERDKLVLKVIDNELDAQLPFRTSKAQFNINPYQRGCRDAASSSAGCVISSFTPLGSAAGAPRFNMTAEQARANRDDRRTIVGARWEHKFDANTLWRTQIVVDDRNISQPTGTTSAVGDFLSTNVMTDIAHRTQTAGFDSTYFLQAYWNTLPVHSYTYFVAPGGNAPLGLLSSETMGGTTNYGVRVRQEVKLDQDWTTVAGIGLERSRLQGRNLAYRYNAAGAFVGQTEVETNRNIDNVAPEVGLVWRPARQWQLRGRIGTGYGTPQFTNLFVTPAGVAGDNTKLTSQKNIGYDLGFDYTPLPGISFSATGFYEFFQNEIATQSAGAGLQSFSFNIPRSDHRGIEAQADLAPRALPGWRLTAAYLFNDQVYTDYTEVLSRTGPSRTSAFDRSGNKIAGNAPHELNARLAYDTPSGPLKGLGAFVEYQWRDAFFMDSGNLLKASASEIVNVNVHYNLDVTGSWLKSARLFFEVRNVFDHVTIASANNITNTLNAAGAENPTGVLADVGNTIYAGPPRTFWGGVKLKF